MLTKQQVIQALDKLNDEEAEKGIAEFIAYLFKGQFVEIYTGESFEDVALEQINTSYSAVICGKVLGAYKTCLVMEVFYTIPGAKESQYGQILFINEGNIQLFKQVDTRITVDSCFIKSKEVTKLVVNE